MCTHESTRLLERAREDDGRTAQGEQLVECRSCGVDFRRYTPNPRKR